MGSTAGDGDTRDQTPSVSINNAILIGDLSARERPDSRFPRRLLLGTACGAILLLFSLIWSDYRAFHEALAHRATLMKLQELRGVIVHLDEVLTMSANMAATTGDLKWEDRYRAHEHPLEAAILEARRLASSHLGSDTIQTTDAANTRLVEMENRVFELVRLDRLKEAQVILAGPSYSSQKDVYADGTRRLSTALALVAESSSLRYERASSNRFLLALLFSTLLAAGWFLVLRSVGRWQASMERRETGLARRAEQLASLSLHLDRKVQERTTELTQVRGEQRRVETALSQSVEQLRQIQKMEAVGRLAGGVAHDFNNMLCVILGFADVARDAVGGDQAVVGCLDEIKKAGERAQSLTRQLLAFSRKQVLQPTVHNINHTIADMENMLRRIIGEHIRLVTTLDPNLPNVKADPGQLQQVIMNLAVNARDAMLDGGTLTIETLLRRLTPEQRFDGEHVLPECYIMIRVTDTGVGMSQETLTRIFEPFFTTKPKGQGTGLGLSTAYGIVQQSNGHIWAESEPGKGTTFEIILPPTEENQNSTQSISRVELGLPDTGTILVAEDEDMVRALTCTTLTVAGFTVLDARNGREALEILDRNGGGVDLLLTDVIMPELGGRELAKRVQARHPDTKILFMSGYSDDTTLDLGVTEGKLPLLMKPFTPAELRAKVRKVLGRAAASVTEGECEEA